LVEVEISLVDKHLEEILDFISSHPWRPAWSRDIAHRFITQLISSPHHLLDFSENGRRLAVFVLLDKIKNKGNNANLEILAIRNDANAAALIGKAIVSALEILPSQFSGIEITLLESLPFRSELVRNYSLKPYYETYQMKLDSLANIKNPPAYIGVQLAGPTDEKEVYAVLEQSFRDNVDTNIPPYAEWSQYRAISKNKSFTAIMRDGGKIVGFVTLNIDQGEINTIGVLPEMRGYGYGRDLILWGLNFLAERGHKSAKLTVAIQNQKALELYQKLGFKSSEHCCVYRIDSQTFN
jgi:ribosomal protein S18 acetylase RimI-like enzyme